MPVTTNNAYQFLTGFLICMQYHPQGIVTKQVDIIFPAPLWVLAAVNLTSTQQPPFLLAPTPITLTLILPFGFGLCVLCRHSEAPGVLRSQISWTSEPRRAAYWQTSSTVTLWNQLRFPFSIIHRGAEPIDFFHAQPPSKGEHQLQEASVSPNTSK